MRRFSPLRFPLLPLLALPVPVLWVAGAYAQTGHALTATARIAGFGGANGGDAKIRGEIKFTQAAAPIRVTGKLTGLPPGKHGFHVHVNGNCDSADGMSAGGHFNPFGAPHGDAGSAKRHLGDMGNIVANANGEAVIDTEFGGAVLTLVGTQSILNRSVIVHAAADDLSQPAGNAGARIGCGVIETDHMAM